MHIKNGWFVCVESSKSIKHSTVQKNKVTSGQCRGVHKFYMNIQ